MASTASADKLKLFIESPLGFGFGAGFPDCLDRLNPGSTSSSNEGERDRQGGILF
jgi:hypothetical protein